MTTLLVIIYISFISLGLPDSILGSIWPQMQMDLNAGLSLAGYISMTITAGAVLSSVMADRMVRKFGVGKVTAVSVLMTAAALAGFSLVPNALCLFLCAIPLGLGAGTVDVALNNFVALHYEAKHMSWLQKQSGWLWRVSLLWVWAWHLSILPCSMLRLITSVRSGPNRLWGWKWPLLMWAVLASRPSLAH